MLLVDLSVVLTFLQMLALVLLLLVLSLLRVLFLQHNEGLFIELVFGDDIEKSLKLRFGDAFDELKNSTSAVPFVAVLDGRQQLDWREFVRPAQLGIAIAVGVFWWAHRFIPQAGALVRNSALESLFS